jgi:hypothetical protein
LQAPRGLAAAADIVHKDERSSSNVTTPDSSAIDYGTLTFEEQMEIAKRQSEMEAARIRQLLIEGLNSEEQVKLALQESMKEQSNVTTPPVSPVVGRPPSDEDDADDEYQKALKLSMDPNQQENPEYKDFFGRLTGQPVSGAAGATARIRSIDELESERFMKTGKKETMSSRIAAKFPPKNLLGYSNEEANEAQLQKAIRASLVDLNGGGGAEGRSSSMSPTHSGRLNGYASAARASTSTGSPARAMLKPVYKKSRRGSYRPVIIDGCNLAFQHGRNDRFSADGLLICYQYFQNLGYDDKKIIIIIKHIPHLPQYDQDLINEMENIGVLHRCPSRRAGREVIKSDDDLFILNTAKELDGIVVSRDQFRDNWDKMETYRDVIRNRLIQPTFLGDNFTLVPDPMGNKGPTLDKFLRFQGD